MGFVWPLVLSRGRFADVKKDETVTEPVENPADTDPHSRSGEPSSHVVAESRYPNRRRASAGKKVTARPMLYPSSSSRSSLSSPVAGVKLDPTPKYDDGTVRVSKVGDENPHPQDSLLARVSDWLQYEKAKLAA